MSERDISLIAPSLVIFMLSTRRPIRLLARAQQHRISTIMSTRASVKREPVWNAADGEHRPLSTARSLSVAPAAGQKFKQRLGRNLDLAAEPQHWGWPLAVVHEPVGGGAAEPKQRRGPDEVEHGGQWRIIGAGRGGGCCWLLDRGRLVAAPVCQVAR
jgi:hypothetical protein